MENVLKLITHSPPILVALLLLTWSWLAISLHATGISLALLRGLVVLALIGLAGAAWQGQWRWIWLGSAVIFTLALVWWFSLTARDDRDWAPDVAHGVTGQVDGDIVTLQNVRNFDWKTETEAEARWETRSYDLSKLTGIDLITSVWSSPAIAHTLISFGFEDGEHIVFSGEIRREKGEAFSAIGGFFKKYELVMIAADEHDIVKLRLDKRHEQVALFPIDIPVALQRQLFLNFITEADALDKKPGWYHTLWANCTTVPYRLVKESTQNVGFDWRILASGYLPSYLHELGILRPDLGDAEVLERAKITSPGPEGTGIAYSNALRKNWQR